MRINYATLCKLSLLEIANFNFALACRHYNISKEQSIALYAEMFSTGDEYEIHYFAGTDRALKKYFFACYTLASYLTGQYKNKMSIHHMFLEVYDLSEKTFQTDRSSQTDINRVVNSIYSFQQARKPIQDPVRSVSVATDAMNKAWARIDEMI